ncbi:YciI family protein [Balneatrix alpica]|uniref:YciI family protein n=1 Tax=Balneatrix alpica TaxID=75684 RepID=UPI0027389F28|nr:YciI family protein [Balneatrix alpica]
MFIVTLKFAAQAAAAKDHLSGHQAWLQQGFDQGLCLLAGSLVEPKGGALLLQSQDRAEVEAWLAQDPFVQHQVVEADIIQVVPSRCSEPLRFLMSEQA